MATDQGLQQGRLPLKPPLVSLHQASLDHTVWLQVLRGAESLEAVQGQQVSRVLVQELGGLFELALLAQVGSVPKRSFLFFPGVSLISPGLLPGAHGLLWKADRVYGSLSPPPFCSQLPL